MKRTKKAIHKLSEIDDDLLMAYCSECETLVKILKEIRSDGKARYRCKNRHRDTLNLTKAPYRQFKKDRCEDPDCTATILYSCQLTVDHIDGNRHNNDISNLMTLCHNCHALKSFRNNDYVNKYD
jgi:5-methylcytosine-specific restriction endonuclease McrA